MLDLEPKLVKRLDELARIAIEHWGVDAQFEMAKEESLELALELQRIKRGRHDDAKILEEAVDSYIMATELFIIFGPEAVNAMMEKKLKKFQAHLSKSIQTKDIVDEVNTEKEVAA